MSTRRLDEEVIKARDTFRDVARQIHEHAKEAKEPKDKTAFKSEVTRNHSLAELCEWFMCRKSMFDKTLKNY